MNSILRTLPRTLLVLLCGMALSAILFLVTAPPRGTGIALAPTSSPAPIMVQVEGAVVQPGLYGLPKDSRVADAVQSAGGLGPQANRDAVNMATRLKDGEKLVIPALGAPTAPVPTQPSRASEIDPNGGTLGSESGSKNRPSQPVNLNTATLEELDALPGIGPTRAEQIIAYREQHGGFKTIEELQEVSGIGPATFEQLKAYISIE